MAKGGGDLADTGEDGGLVQGLQLPIAHDHPAVDDRMKDIAAAGRVHQMRHRMVDRSQVRLVKIEHDAVGLFADTTGDGVFSYDGIETDRDVGGGDERAFRILPNRQ